MPVRPIGSSPSILGALAFLAGRSIDLNIYAQVGLATLIGLAAKNVGPEHHLSSGVYSQQSLGTVIFGGLVVVTVLSLGVVPPVYVLVKNLVHRLFTRQDASAQQAKV